MSIKFYKHNKRGEVVAVTKTDRFEDSYKVLYCDGTVGYFSSDHVREYLTPLPEAPEVRSAEWAVQMLNKGEKLKNPTSEHGDYIYLYLGEVLFADGWKFRDFQDYLFDGKHGFELYEEPKPIIEKLPHDFVKDEEVLVRVEGGVWQRRTFHSLSFNNSRAHVYVPTLRDARVKSHSLLTHWEHFIPYEGNEHLEGKVTEGDHGAVPDGYVPPHVPKLGDDDYWMVGDEVSSPIYGIEGKVIDVHLGDDDLESFIGGITVIFPWDRNPSSYLLNGKQTIEGTRVIYHKGSYVRDDGTVHEHVPTRPYRIEKE